MDKQLIYRYKSGKIPTKGMQNSNRKSKPPEQPRLLPRPPDLEENSYKTGDFIPSRSLHCSVESRDPKSDSEDKSKV